MINVHKFIFNPFQVNTYILSDESGECVIIDPGCSDGVESLQLFDYLKHEGLTAVRVLLTHTHIDHVIGVNMLEESLGIKAEAHKAGMVFLDHSVSTASTYGLHLDENPRVGTFIEAGDVIRFGKSELEVLYTPGHADGSICFLSKDDGFVIVGDVLFQLSIGRTDFPTGDYDILRKSIFEELFTLPDDTVVYSGHGPETSIGFEKMNNPFLGGENFIH